MPARVLVVDDILPNVKVLEAKLSAEYFEVATAMNGRDALASMAEDPPDIVLLDVMMPEMDGVEVCRIVKADPKLSHIPIVMVTALSEPGDRVRGLEAGADDFLTKPVNDVALFARVRSLVRLKMMMDEFRLREQTSSEMGVLGEEGAVLNLDTTGANILVIDDSIADGRVITSTLEVDNQVTVVSEPEKALDVARYGNFDLIIVSLLLRSSDGLRLCSNLRTMDDTRQASILVLIEDNQIDQLVKALDIGANDYLMKPIDRNELLARALTQIRRKRYQDRLRENYQLSMAMAVTDVLTGLHNRRYMESHLGNLVRRAVEGGRPVSLVMLDIDFFKAVNDTHGHDVGDEVLKEFAHRIQQNVRGIDLAARYGGEEFMIVMPETDLTVAQTVAERLRGFVAEQPFKVSADVGELVVTVSLGVTVSGPGDVPETMIKRADDALYKAKHDGRNRVVIIDGPPAED
ncbi:MAG: PleD family two-component system response regulator [Alphaproteobacteria bacterium]|jgi:two-component system, cell cycle response regulator|nr:PleD family two-component system response regulator [Alphaproteobacteria bacterium]MBT4018834.1 PleD family two-component system response regulator [Alphaproteobacteria bacterium]MBT4965583.1 PleD family two-component system response regulator [Alphaproteobacteria bacterium]MBT6387949.1 PleD family two-component system response regulator [Alphaproteobacteria bacterium]